jgi:hypothetical protein
MNPNPLGCAISYSLKKWKTRMEKEEEWYKYRSSVCNVLCILSLSICLPTQSITSLNTVLFCVMISVLQ